MSDPGRSAKKMTDVTQHFDRFREASRHLRNSYCEKGKWELSEYFDDIDRSLFAVLVLIPISKEAQNPPAELISGQDYQRYFDLVPHSEYGIPVMISRERDGGGYWDHPVKELSPPYPEIRFLEVFDWDQIGFRDMKYYMGDFITSKQHPEIVGHRVLIECQYLKVISKI